jgi:hypothetical protein
MTISKNVYTFRTRVLFNPDGSIATAEIVRKAQIVEDGRVISEVEDSVRTLADPSALAPLIAKVNTKFEELYASEQAAKAKAAAENETVDKMVKGAK